MTPWSRRYDVPSSDVPSSDGRPGKQVQVQDSRLMGLGFRAIWVLGVKGFDSHSRTGQERISWVGKCAGFRGLGPKVQGFWTSVQDVNLGFRDLGLVC